MNKLLQFGKIFAITAFGTLGYLALMVLMATIITWDTGFLVYMLTDPNTITGVLRLMVIVGNISAIVHWFLTKEKKND